MPTDAFFQKFPYPIKKNCYKHVLGGSRPHFIYTTLTSLKSVPKSVSRKERPGTLFTCYHAKSDKVALRRKKKKLFFPRTQPIFEGKKSRKAEFFRKNRGKWPKFVNFPRILEFFRDFRSFTAKKASPPCKERPGSARKSVPPRKERHMERATFRK